MDKQGINVEKELFNIIKKVPTYSIELLEQINTKIRMRLSVSDWSIHGDFYPDDLKLLKLNKPSLKDLADKCNLFKTHEIDYEDALLVLNFIRNFKPCKDTDS